VKLTTAVERYVADMVREGRFTSPHSELAYRTKLMRLAEHVRNRDPRTVGRVDIKAVLAQWPNPASQNQAHAVYASFFDWCLTEPRDRNERETICTTNPARRVRRAKAKQAQVFRMTRSEVVAFLDASLDRQRDRWVAHLGCCAGLRSQEIRGLQGRHFERPGYVWVSRDIGKGGKERWVPVIDGPRADRGGDPRARRPRQVRDPGPPVEGLSDPGRVLRRRQARVSASALFKQVVAIGERAGVPGKVTPHIMRHAYGDHIASHAGLRVAQALMGHERVDTTASTYVQRPGMEELAAQVRGFSFRRGGVIGLPEVSEADMAHG
jgi:integrase/recombinase XerD